MRIPHIMKRNKNSETPSRAIWLCLNIYASGKIGIRTDYAFDFGWLCAGVKNQKTGSWALRWYRFTSALGFWKLLDVIPAEKTRTYIIIEDSAKTLPLLDVFKLSYKRGWTCTRAILQNPPTILRWRRENTSLLLLDKSNVWPTQSSAISTGKSGQESPRTSGGNAPCKHDERIKRAVQTMQLSAVQWWSFLRSNDLGGFSSTIGTQALRTFRHKYMTHPIMIDTHTEALTLAREGYHGGRTECWYIGKTVGEYYLLDVNSMYAAVMRDMLVPTKLIGYTTRAKLDDLEIWCKNRVVIADCDVETPEPCYAVKRDLALKFPVGRFRTVLSGNEVVHALRHSAIRKIHRVAVYNGELAFRDFVQAMWQERRVAVQRGDAHGADKYKLLLASFYGKWGQSGGTWETIDEVNNSEIRSWTNIDRQTGEVTEFRQFSGIVQQLMVEQESSESVPSIAACITANARMVLWMLMEEAGLENVLYVDTDSILCNANGLHAVRRYVLPDDLGGLRLEGGYREVFIRASKDYVFGDRVRRKGVSGSSHVITDTQFDQENTKSLAAMFRDGDMSKSYSRRVRKTLTHSYNKGVVSACGRVTPIRLQEW